MRSNQITTKVLYKTKHPTFAKINKYNNLNSTPYKTKTIDPKKTKTVHKDRYNV